MRIHNKKLIGLIASLVGLAILGYMAFAVTTVFYNQKTTASVSGFVNPKYFSSRKTENEHSSSNFLKGRIPYVKFVTEKGQSVETYSAVPQLFAFMGYHLHDEVNLYYNPQRPTQAFVADVRELPGLFLMLLFGLLLTWMGKSFLFQKSDSTASPD
ncbi:MAG: hypothetical protein BGN96_08335 [Bacteroidales bacterium 45-6]|nr:MAG: hypothetical protein BGN96_08335 [Bacteroidales bacterium 45-6]